MRHVVEQYQNSRFGSFKRKREYLEKYNIRALPVTKQLVYRYDYGDGWKVNITCDAIYERSEQGAWRTKYGDIEDKLVDSLEIIYAKHRPVCIEKME